MGFLGAVDFFLIGDFLNIHKVQDDLSSISLLHILLAILISYTYQELNKLTNSLSN